MNCCNNNKKYASHRWLIVGSILIIPLIIGLLLLLIGGHKHEYAIRVESYDGLTLGLPESQVLNTIADNEYINIGIVEDNDGEYYWIWQHVEDGPIRSKISYSSVSTNSQWDALGWTYPSVFPYGKVIVVYDGQSIRSTMLYLYFDESNTLKDIFVGYS